MSADGDIVRSRLSFPSEPEVAAALARLEAAEAEERANPRDVHLYARLDEVVAQRDALAEALRMQGWDIGEAQLCWCPPGWWDREEDTGAEQTEHSTGCRMARAAMEALA